MQQGSGKSDPLRVTQEAIDAYERQTGFHGIGKIMVEHGVWVIVPKGEVPANPWYGRGCTGAQGSGASGQDQPFADSAVRNRERAT